MQRQTYAEGDNKVRHHCWLLARAEGCALGTLRVLVIRVGICLYCHCSLGYNNIYLVINCVWQSTWCIDVFMVALTHRCIAHEGCSCKQLSSIQRTAALQHLHHLHTSMQSTNFTGPVASQIAETLTPDSHQAYELGTMKCFRLLVKEKHVLCCELVEAREARHCSNAPARIQY